MASVVPMLCMFKFAEMYIFQASNPLKTWDHSRNVTQTNKYMYMYSYRTVSLSNQTPVFQCAILTKVESNPFSTDIQDNCSVIRFLTFPILYILHCKTSETMGTTWSGFKSFCKVIHSWILILGPPLVFMTTFERYQKTAFFQKKNGYRL